MKNILNHIEEILGMVCLFPGVMISFISRLGGWDKRTVLTDARRRVAHDTPLW